jgi:hypothetical protein
MAVNRQPGLKNLTRFLPGRYGEDAWDWRFKVSYIVLQLIDLGLTLAAAQCGFAELNPFVRGLLASPLEMAVVKVFIPLLMVWVLPGRFLLPAIALLLWVIGWNVKELALLAF